MTPTDFNELAEDTLDAVNCAVATAVRYEHKQGGVSSIRGVFDERHTAIDSDTEIVVSGNFITLGVKLKDLRFLPQKGDIVTVLFKRKRYRVIDSQEDGVAGSELTLHELDI